MFFEDIKLRESINVAPVQINAEEMLAFAKRYDNIPLHTDDKYCQNTRFGKIIAPGVMSFMAVWANYLKVDICEEELIAGKSTKMEWLKPVYANDILTAQAMVTNKTPNGQKSGIVEITFYIYNQQNELVMTNVTEMVVKCRCSD